MLKQRDCISLTAKAVVELIRVNLQHGQIDYFYSADLKQKSSFLKELEVMSYAALNRVCVINHTFFPQQLVNRAAINASNGAKA